MSHRNATAPLPTVQVAMAKSLQQQQESLQLFLKEGITLYEYLCQKLQQQLVQMVHQFHHSSHDNDKDKTMNEEGKDEEDDIDVEKELPPFNGIVPCLYRLYIHLGDLYRYGDTNHTLSLASASYMKAMRLGPAYGHAYNQLAVIYQTKDTVSSSTSISTPTSSPNKNQNNAITTVYWYTRSLGATQEPFVTAASNLLRLFESNRQWLQQEQSQNKKILLRPGSTNHHKKKDDGSDPMPSAKVVSTNQSNMSRLCLSNFVDLQYTFYTVAKDDTMKQEHSNVPNLPSLTNQIRTTIAMMQELLNNSSLSDSLLCKLITIMAFMEYHCHHNNDVDSSSLPPNEKHSHSPPPTSGIWKLRFLVRIMIYELGHSMAERVHRTITSKIQKQQQKSASTSNTTTTTTTVPSIRVLLPLLLLTEYVLHTETTMNPQFSIAKPNPLRMVTTGSDIELSSNRDHFDKEQFQSTYTLFWKQIIDVYNHILLLDCIVHDPSASDTNTNSNFKVQPILVPSHSHKIQEYQELRGFLPFESFLKDPNDSAPYLTDAGYLSDTVTVQMIDTLWDPKGTNIHQHRSASSNRYTSQGSFSTNISVASSTTNNSATDQTHSKEAMLLKLRRFVTLRTTLISTLQRHVRVHHSTNELVWTDDRNDDIEYTYNADTIMQCVSSDKTAYENDDDDDGGDYIVAMVDENECTINAINSLVADKNTASITDKYQHNESEMNRNSDALLMYQHENDGPALLVPGALLFESLNKTAATSSTTTDATVFMSPSVQPLTTTATTLSFNSLFDGNDAKMNAKSIETKISPNLTPPPGFASTSGKETNSHLFTSNNDFNKSVGVEMALNGSPAINNNNYHSWFGTSMLHGTTPTSTIGESMLLFGGPSGLQTANPFAVPSTDSRLFFDRTPMETSSPHNYLPSLTDNNDMGTLFGSRKVAASEDDALLFNSGLLRSLLMEETTTGAQQPSQQPQTTRNPFA
jgi:hypothetical protein